MRAVAVVVNTTAELSLQHAVHAITQLATPTITPGVQVTTRQ
jgi:hypothetical protein